MSPDPWGEPSRGRPLPVAAAVSAAALALALLAFAWSAFETRTQKAELRSLMKTEGEALAEAVGHAVEHALQAGIQMEELSSERLLDQARLLERLDAAGLLRGEVAEEVASELGLSRILVVDPRLRPVLEAPVSGPALLPPAEDPFLPLLKPILDGKAEEIVVTPREPTAPGPGRFVAAVRRSRGGAILVALDGTELLDFEERVGAENLMQAVADTGGILLAVLEDDRGRELARADSREGAEEEGGLEVRRPVELAHGRMGTLKIRLSTRPLAAAGLASRRRTAVTAALVFLVTLALAAVALALRRALLLRGEAARARSVTGAVLEGMSDGVVVSDALGVIRLVNPAAENLFGVRPGSLQGSRCDASPCAPLVTAARRDGRATEVDLQRPEGAPVRILAAVSPVRDEAGTEVGTALLVRDLTDLKRLEREARRTESLAAFGRLAAAVAHEVRNPLNAIAVGVQRLEREFPPAGRGEEHRKLTTLLRSEIQRLNGTVTRFLELARPPRLEPRPGELGSLVRETVGFLSGSAPPGIRVQAEAGPVPPAVFDPGAVRQVILNLSRNAFEALGERGTVRISLRREERWAVLAVADDGPGISAADRERIFDFGYSTRPGGNGLGLPIVHRLVTEMGGSVRVESQPGKGTEVQVRLPLSAEAAA